MGFFQVGEMLGSSKWRSVVGALMSRAQRSDSALMILCIVVSAKAASGVGVLGGGCLCLLKVATTALLIGWLPSYALDIALRA